MVHEVAARRAAKGYGFDGYRVGELVREIIRRARACRWKPHAALFKLNPRGGNGGVGAGGGGGGSDCGGGTGAGARGGGNDLSIATSPYDPLRLPRRHSSERCSDRRPHRTTYSNNPPHEGEYGYLRSRVKGLCEFRGPPVLPMCSLGVFTVHNSAECISNACQCQNVTFCNAQ
ncbi:hypothetical protein V1478_009828 [Vespula squamosa]|uniref:Uncharacterized protein n=1 Tax=Vespula squamosa TaxID=30214 RepID=A0ABD2AJI5_VESSQ